MEIPKILMEKAEELERYYQEYFPKAGPLAKQCFLNTIETTVKKSGEDFFVITGDLPAMWLRDSSYQVMHYVRYAAEEEELQDIIRGIIRRQTRMVLLDPYANAFNEEPNGNGFTGDLTEMNSHIWERKYEMDSLCAPIYLAYKYWKLAGGTDIFDGEWLKMLYQVYRVFKTEQRHEKSEYTFVRPDCPETDTLPCGGLGNPVGYTGMTWTGFRPSDDRCIYGYLVPAQMMGVHALLYGAEMLEEIYGDRDGGLLFRTLAAQMDRGIREYGIVDHEIYGRMYAYETDGLGNYVLMDDANCPSLLSLPYLDCCRADDDIYLNTRKFILSEENPYFFSGKCLKGVGSPHTKDGNVWPIGVTMQALTSQSREEKILCLDMLTNSHAGTCYMHESVNADLPQDYTRPWFAWANSLFAELLIQVMEEGILEE